MNDSPGWAPPGSAPSDERGAGVPRPSGPVDSEPPAASRPAEGNPADTNAAGANPAEANPADTKSADANDANGNVAAGQWSPTQPPPGQWSAPASSAPGPGAPPPPAPGWGGNPNPGGHPGWGNQPPQGWVGPQGWGRTPTAPKPGVVPLRPLSVGEVLDGSVSAMRAHWRTALGISLVVAVFVQVVSLLIERFLLPEPITIDQNASDSEILRQSIDAMRSLLVSTAPSAVLGMAAVLFTASVLSVVVSRSVLGRTVTPADVRAEARPRVLGVVGLALLLAVAIVAIMAVGLAPGLLVGSAAGAGLIVLGFPVASVVALWLMTLFCLSAPALVLERQSVGQALRRSAKLVRGAWWRIFGILALTCLCVAIVSVIIGIPFALIGLSVDGGVSNGLFSADPTPTGWPFLLVSSLGGVLISMLTYPFVSGVISLLYIDQRIRREALDLELGRAAGLPGYASNGG
ncbi:glycerophosphoryl diester phosphodiesterase membrane domain-containing protein [Streptomyces sp. NBC_00247]|uniref:glycerophosphoryl diester phosphodiesterase membrane domain-containing protein n=1 Tax=Streptomyces sp. NBC_00247 TaxID=2975689 RepID=UPI002E2A900A|nr:glycerophosphoryl diester phosphodiesterase membrane domain-containing protein [Streptomyces sp. NBC_00247]